MGSLFGKRCVITGGSRGIGLAIAELFASQGATCTLVGRDAAALSGAAARLTTATAAMAPLPLPHNTFAMDVSNPNSWNELVASARSVSWLPLLLLLLLLLPPPLRLLRVWGLGDKGTK